MAKGSVVGELLHMLCGETGIVPFGAIAPEYIVLWFDVGRLTQRPGRNDQAAALEAGVGHQ